MKQPTRHSRRSHRHRRCQAERQVPADQRHREPDCGGGRRRCHGGQPGERRGGSSGGRQPGSGCSPASG